MKEAEIREILAEHENRIGCLENSIPGSAVREETQAEAQEQPWTGKQWDIINQLRAEVQHIHSEVHEMKTEKKTEKKNTKRKSDYD